MKLMYITKILLAQFPKMWARPNGYMTAWCCAVTDTFLDSTLNVLLQINKELCGILFWRRIYIWLLNSSCASAILVQNYWSNYCPQSCPSCVLTIKHNSSPFYQYSIFTDFKIFVFEKYVNR